MLRCLIQAGNANYLQKALSNQTSNFQVIEEKEGQARVENIVQLGPLLAIKAGGTCAPEGASRTMVSLDDIRAELGPFRSANIQKHVCNAELSYESLLHVKSLVNCFTGPTADSCGHSHVSCCDRCMG